MDDRAGRNRLLLAAALLVGVTVTLATAAAPGGLAATSSATEVAQATPVVAVSPTGNDATCARMELRRPCATFNRAYELARCGDAVELQPGLYGDQNIVDASPAKACTDRSYIVFRPRERNTVTVSRVSFGMFGVGNGGDWVEIRDVAVQTRVEPLHGSSHIRVIRVDGGSFYIHAAHDVYFQGNDWGPCASSGTPNCIGQNFIDANYASPLRTYNIDINGDRFHDFTITQGSGDHFECLFVTGANGRVTIRNSRFENCETYGIFFQARDPSHGFDSASFVISNNFFGRTCCYETRERNSALNFASNLAPKNILIQNNSFIRGQGLISEGGATPVNVRAVGNVFGYRTCVTGVQYTRNLFPDGGCSATDRSTVYGYRYDGTRLVVDPARAKAVREAFRAVATGSPVPSTARSLGRSRAAAPTGRWTASSVRQLLTDDIYLGRRLGRQAEHAPLVSAARWKAVQRALKRS